MSSELKTNKVSPATGTALTLADSGDTLTLPSGATLDIASGATIANSGTATGFGGDNTPVWSAFSNTDQTGLGNNVVTKCAMTQELYDSDSAYDTSTYRFTVPSGEGGRYFVYANVAAGGGTSNFIYGQCHIYKNGTSFVTHSSNDNGGYGQNKTMSISTILDLSAADYLEVYAQVYLTTGTFSILQNNTNGGGTNFGGFKLL